MSKQTAITLHPVHNYTFGIKEAAVERDPDMAIRMDRLRDRYHKEGMRQSVEGILLVHEHNHPHVILFQHGTKEKPSFRLIGGRLRPGEDEISGLIRKLDSSLSPLGTSLVLKWQIGECIGMFWRPNFEEHLYPYLPAHITRPKEAKRLFMVHLPDRAYFAVPKNLNLKAIPLFELYSNQVLYGSLLAALPQMVSRYRFNLAGSVQPIAAPKASNAATSLPETTATTAN
ncbi:hypothetical protein WJX84_006898 [Apatococcus fuscideae]|uniref:Pre-mRNA cleavage factor Im 25 kDa subunit n=1 Tax=Apatococcus fuscideae TaxID=2026836 RepID=A0AAW1T8J8_9CHLO